MLRTSALVDGHHDERPVDEHSVGEMQRDSDRRRLLELDVADLRHRHVTETENHTLVCVCEVCAGS